jgi:hypothetical protein
MPTKWKRRSSQRSADRCGLGPRLGLDPSNVVGKLTGNFTGDVKENAVARISNERHVLIIIKEQHKNTFPLPIPFCSKMRLTGRYGRMVFGESGIGEWLRT